MSYYLVEDGDAPPTLALCTQDANGKNDTLYFVKNHGILQATGGSVLGSMKYSIETTETIAGLNLLYDALMMARTK